MDPQANAAFSWEALEFEYKKKKADWFWAIGIILVCGIIICIILKNYLFAFFLLLTGFLVFTYANREPEVLTISINDRGIAVNKTFYPFINIHSFWLFVDKKGNTKLLVHTKRLVLPFVTVTVDEEIDTEKLREFLLTFIPEKENQEPFEHVLSERIGF